MASRERLIACLCVLSACGRAERSSGNNHSSDAGESPGGTATGGSAGAAGTRATGGAAASDTSGAAAGDAGDGSTTGGTSRGGTDGGAGDGGSAGSGSGGGGKAGAGAGSGGAGSGGVTGGGGVGGMARAGSGGGGSGNRDTSVAIFIATGVSHTCAILVSGALRCWGEDFAGAHGYGTAAGNVGDDEYPSTLGDVPVGTTVLNVDLGRNYTCAVLTGGAVKCWGYGTEGQLGYGDEENRQSIPTANVAVGGPVKQITTGDSHTCALLETGTVRCWGYADFGTLGYVAGALNLRHVLAPGRDIDVGGTVTQIDSGGSVTCAVLTTGALRCWGIGLLGRLGYGSTESIGDDETPASAGDVPIGGRVLQVSVADTHSCAVLEGGGVRCWGHGGSYMLGYGSTADVGDDETPAAMGDVNLGGSAVQVVTGHWHTCALLTNGRVRCWGLGNRGRLGYGTSSDNASPSGQGDVDVGGTVVQLAAGEAYTCARLTNGHVRCWGEGAFGRLGYGNEELIGNDEVPAAAGDVPF